MENWTQVLCKRSNLWSIYSSHKFETLHLPILYNHHIKPSFSHLHSPCSGHCLCVYTSLSFYIGWWRHFWFLEYFAWCNFLHNHSFLLHLTLLHNSLYPDNTSLGMYNNSCAGVLKVHLGWLLATMNSTIISTAVWGFALYTLFISFGNTAGNQLLHHVVILVLVLRRSCA